MYLINLFFGCAVYLLLLSLEFKSTWSLTWTLPGALRGVPAPTLESESEVAQSCPTLCDPMDCSLSGSSVHGIFQARVLEWIAISFPRGSSRPRNRTQVSHIAGRHFTVWATKEWSRWLFLENPVFHISILHLSEVGSGTGIAVQLDRILRLFTGPL